MLAWIQNFLTERRPTHCTRGGISLSSTKYLTSGVVQGSCLGPILFVVYINDIVSVFDQCCVCKLYADDLKLYMRMSIAGCAHTFQKCIDDLTLWSRTWQLNISHQKCSVLQRGIVANDCDRDYCIESVPVGQVDCEVYFNVKGIYLKSVYIIRRGMPY